MNASTCLAIATKPNATQALHASLLVLIMMMMRTKCGLRMAAQARQLDSSQLADSWCLLLVEMVSSSALLLQAGEQYRPALDTKDWTARASARLEMCSLMIAEVSIRGFQSWLFQDFRVDYLMIAEVIIWGSKGWLCRLIRIVANRKISQSKGSAAENKQKDNDRGHIANSRKLK